MLDIGQKIRLLREQHGLRQINPANALQVTLQAVSKWVAFLVLDYVARHCTSGIGATDAVMKPAQGHYHTALHARVTIDLIDETVAVHEIHLS